MNLRYIIFDWWQQRLSRQIILPTALATMLFLAALGFVAFRAGQNTIEEQVNIRNLELARLISDDINRFFQILLDTTRLQEAQLLDQENTISQIRAMQALRRTFPGTYSSLWLVDPEARLLLSMIDSNKPRQTFDVNRYDPPREVPLDPSVAAGLEADVLSVSEIHFRPITDWPYITATLPLANEAGEKGGALVAEIDLRTFWSRVDAIDIESGNAIIVDHNGYVLAHPNRQLIGTQMAITPVAAAFAGFEGSTTYTHDGDEYIVSYSPVGGVAPWAVLVEQRSDVAFAPVRSAALVALTATILSAFCVAAIVSSLVRHSIRPVEELSRISSQIANSAEINETLVERTEQLARQSGASEIGTLASSFTSMIGSLQVAQQHLLEWNETLEQRVDERTAQLHTVLEIARLSGASLREQDVLHTLLAQIEHLIDYDSAVIMLLDRSGTALDFLVAADLVAQQPRATRIPLDRYPLNQMVLERQTTIIVPDTRLEPLWRDIGDKALSWLGAPLMVQERSIGILALLKQDANFYTHEHATLLRSLAAQVGVMLAHARLYEDSVQRVEREIREAEQIQKHLFRLPPHVSGLDVTAYFRPARETTGDFYEFLTAVVPTNNGQLLHGATTTAINAPTDLAPGQLAVILGDVSGKSLPAALLMAMARTALRAAARAVPYHSEGVMELANATLVGELPRGSFVAATYALIDREQLTLHLINAAQPAPLLLREGQIQELTGVGSHLPLGIAHNPAYESACITLHPRDVIVFYTDGLVEAHNERRELLGFDRVTTILQSLAARPHLDAAQVVERLLAEVAEWAGTAPQSDDIAIVVVQIT